MSNKADKNAWRRIAYNYYRAKGYSPAEARQLRGRTKQVVTDYRQDSIQAKREQKAPPTPPNFRELQIKSRQREQYQIAKEVLGLTPKQAERFRRLDGITFAERIANITKAKHRLEVAGAMKGKEFDKFLKAALDKGWKEYYRILRITYDKAIVA